MKKLEGIILQSFEVSEVDRIYIIFSREKGKIKVLSKGVRKLTARLAYCLEPITYTEISLIEGRSWDRITGATLLNQYTGIKSNFVQDNHSLSKEKGVLRGLHFQKPPFAQAKLVRAIKGEVYDVIVDLRKKSKTFGKWEGFKLNEKNKLMLYVPRGFAHGFCTLRKDTEFLYKTDNFYAPESEGGVIWNDETLKIDWPINQPILSEKDKRLVDFKELNSPF